MSAEQKVEKLVKKKINKALRNIFSDPDFGVELKADFVKDLKKSVKEKENDNVVPLDEVLSEYNK